MRRLLVLLAATFLSFGANAASVQTVDSVGDSFTVHFDGSVINTTSTLAPGLSASAKFTISSWGTAGGQTTVVFDIFVDNNVNASIWQSATITAIGFDTDPNATGGSSTGVFGKFLVGGSFPTGSGFSVEYCASNNSTNCRGPGTTPLNLGQSGTATVTMTFAGSVDSLDFSNFGIVYQRLNSQSLGYMNDFGVGKQTPPIPEPGSMAVFGLGALLIGASLRKRTA